MIATMNPSASTTTTKIFAVVVVVVVAAIAVATTILDHTDVAMTTLSLAPSAAVEAFSTSSLQMSSSPSHGHNNIKKVKSKTSTSLFKTASSSSSSSSKSAYQSGSSSSSSKTRLNYANSNDENDDGTNTSTNAFAATATALLTRPTKPAAAATKRPSTMKKKAVIKIDKTIRHDVDHHQHEEHDDPVQSIAFLNDPSRKYKKSAFRRPMTLAELDRKRNSLERAMTKAKAHKRTRNDRGGSHQHHHQQHQHQQAQAAYNQAQFEYGQRCAERALETIFHDYGMTNENVDSYTMMTKMTSSSSS